MAPKRRHARVSTTPPLPPPLLEYPRLTLLGLPKELKTHIVQLAADQDANLAARRHEEYRTALETMDTPAEIQRYQRAAAKKRNQETIGKTIKMVFQTCRELWELAAVHRFRVSLSQPSQIVEANALPRHSATPSAK